MFSVKIEIKAIIQEIIQIILRKFTFSNDCEYEQSGSANSKLIKLNNTVENKRRWKKTRLKSIRTHWKKMCVWYQRIRVFNKIMENSSNYEWEWREKTAKSEKKITSACAQTTPTTIRTKTTGENTKWPRIRSTLNKKLV